MPGGFSYGDDVAAGRILANQMRGRLADAVHAFRDAGRLVLGICNGFQVLIQTGVLLPDDSRGAQATLTGNDSGRFEDRWVNLQVASDRCPLLAGLGIAGFVIGTLAVRSYAGVRFLDRVWRLFDRDAQPALPALLDVERRLRDGRSIPL